MQSDCELVALKLAVYIGVPTFFLAVGWLAGHLSERRHERSLADREWRLADVEAIGMRNPPGFSRSNGPCALVTGEAVVASDAFKSWLFRLQNVVGGRSGNFSRLFDRARREALLRMKQAARDIGCDAVCNVRFDCADIGGNTAGARGKKNMNMAVALVSGTAWRRSRA